MSMPFSTLATGVVGVSIVHSLVPHHWLPFVIVGRNRAWSTKKTLSLLSLGAFVHILSTIVVGLIVGFLGHELDKRFEVLHGVVPGLILFAFGSGFFLSSFNHFHHEVSERMAAPSLILMLGLSPCFVVAPFFLLMGPMNAATVVELSLLMSVMSIAGMTGLGWLAMKGLDVLRLDWLERNESKIMGTLLMILGISFIIL